MQKRFDIEGMTCSACSNTIEKNVSKLPGINKCSVNLLTNSMDLEYDDKKINQQQIADTVSKLGYKALTKDDKTKLKQPEKDHLKTQKNHLIASAILTSILFYLAMSKMLNILTIPFLASYNGTFALIFSQFILTTIVCYLNKKFFISGFKALFHKSPNMDSLVALSASSSFIYGVYSFYNIGYYLATNNIDQVNNYASNLYFDSAAMIVTLISIGKYFEAKSKKQTTSAISKLIDLQAKTAMVKIDNQLISKKIEEVLINDIVVCKPGEQIPLDGTIINGKANINEAMITGESMPVYKDVNNEVIGSTINLDGYLEIKVTKTSENSTLQNIIKLVEAAANSKAKISKLADKISGIFVPVVILIALITFTIWYLYAGDFQFALNFALSVLVISCPCALGLATPVSIMVSTGVAANHGILIKEADVIENGSQIKNILLDKTGTITKGQPTVKTHDDLNPQHLAILTALESLSTHPLAKAVCNSYQYPDLKFDNYQEISGRGIKANLDSNSYLAGNYQLLIDNHIDTSPIEKQYQAYSKLGYSTIITVLNKQILGIVGIADEIKTNSKATIEKLQNLGYHVVMLTGDNQIVAANIAKELNIQDYQAGILPADKQQLVQKYQKTGKTMMVGDGINDSIALVESDVGIAIGSGSDVAIDSADVILVNSDLSSILTYLQLAKKTILNIKENLFWAFIYNIILIPLAAGVLYLNFNIKLNPMFAAAAMSVSSITVVSNALRLKKFHIKKEKQEKTMTKTIHIEGMMCQHCVDHVTKALNQVNGVTANVDLSKNQATVSITNQTVTDAMLTKAIEEAGYQVTAID